MATKRVYLVLDENNDYITTVLTRDEGRRYRKSKNIENESHLRAVNVQETTKTH